MDTILFKASERILKMNLINVYYTEGQYQTRNWSAEETYKYVFKDEGGYMPAPRKTVIKKRTAIVVQDWLKIELFYGGTPMNKLISCEFNIDSGYVELIYSDGSMLAIDCTAVENSIETTINGRSEMEWLIYNAPLDYAELVLSGELEGYLKRVSGPYSGIGWDS